MNKFLLLSGLYAGSSATLKAAGFIISLWLARSLSVSDFGEYGVQLAIQTGVAAFGLVGIYEAVVSLLRECSSGAQRRRLFSDAKHVFRSTVGVTLALAALYVFFADEMKLDVAIFLSVLISGALLAYGSLQAQIMRLDERHTTSLAYSFVSPGIGLASGAIFFGITHSMGSFFVGSCLGLFISTLIFTVLLSKMENGLPDSVCYREKLYKRIVPYIAIGFFGWMSGYGNNLVVSELFSNIEVAHFTFAMSIGAIMQLVASALNQVWSPRFFNILHNEKLVEVERKNHKFFLVLGAVLGLIAMIAIGILPPLFNFIGGNLAHYAGMQLEFFLLFSGYIVLIPWWHHSNYFLAHDKGVNVMNITLATSVAGILLWLVLMWLLGEIGIYLGFFAQMLLRSVGIVIVARRFWDLRTSWAAPSIGISFAAAGLLVSRG